MSRLTVLALLLHLLALAVAILEVSLPPPHDRISFAIASSDERAAKPVTAAEQEGKEACSYIADGPPGATALCGIEAGTQAVIAKYVLANSTVLETGARYGTTTCFIASIQNNSGRLVSIEPDSRVWSAFVTNRRTHRCMSWFVRGTASATDSGDLVVIPGGGGYATRTLPRAAGLQQAADIATSVSHWTLDSLSVITGLRFDTLIIDCEGCIQSLLPLNATRATFARLLRNIKTIVLEGDMPMGAPDCADACVDYAAWTAKFEEAGFALAETTPEPLYPFIMYYVYIRKPPAHRAMLRG